jgi:hypothetical protein
MSQIKGFCSLEKVEKTPDLDLRKIPGQDMERVLKEAFSSYVQRAK